MGNHKLKSIFWDASVYLLWLFGLFSVHRCFSIDLLVDAPLSPLKYLSFGFVGLMSDLWLACLWTILLLPFEAILRKLLGWKHLALGLIPAFLIPSVLMHQTYVDFFRYQLIPFHLSYLLDLDFAAASFDSNFNPRTMVLASFALLSLWASMVYGKAWGDHRRLGTKKSLLIYTTIILLGLLAHNRNIHLRVQWFVPTELQVNYWERLYFHIKENPVPSEILSPEREALSQSLQLEKTLDHDTWLHKVMMLEPNHFSMDDRAKSLKKAIASITRAGRAPNIITIVLEGHRPSEVLAYQRQGKDLKASISPHLDKLASESILFTRAYSTGTVTRGGQEALWCGYLGSQNTSMMRNRKDVQLRCLPDMLHSLGSGISFWHHAGVEAFDGQGAFWRQHQVSELISEKDFPKASPRTPWGYSDKSLYQMSLKKLQELRRQNPKVPILGMILSLTHHIPWVLPEDASPELKARAKELMRPEYASSYYADEALGSYITALKKSSMWQDSLLIVASDHGFAGEGYHPQGETRPNWAEQKSHIVMMMAGGIVEAAGLKGTVESAFVSQADSAPLIASLLSLEGNSFMAEPLLTKKRLRPVMVDLGSQIYEPSSGVQMNRSLLAGYSGKNEPSISLLATYYKAFLHYLNLASTKAKVNDQNL